MTHKRPRPVNRQARSAGPLFHRLKSGIDHLRRLEWLVTKALAFARLLVDWLERTRLDDWASAPLTHT